MVGALKPLAYDTLKFMSFLKSYFILIDGVISASYIEW